MKKGILSIALLSTLAISAAAQAETTVVKANDGTTTTTTFITRSTDTDPAAKTVTTRKDFTTYAYKRWDKNSDGYITPDEWDTNVVTWYGPTKVTTYKTYKD